MLTVAALLAAGWWGRIALPQLDASAVALLAAAGGFVAWQGLSVLWSITPRPVVGDLRQGARAPRLSRARVALRALASLDSRSARGVARCGARLGARRQGDPRILPRRRAGGPASEPRSLLERARPAEAILPFHSGSGFGTRRRSWAAPGALLVYGATATNTAGLVADRASWRVSSQSGSGSCSPTGGSRERCSGSRVPSPRRRWPAGRSRGPRWSTTARLTPTASATAPRSACWRSSAQLSWSSPLPGARVAELRRRRRWGGLSSSAWPALRPSASSRSSSPSATRPRGPGISSPARRRRARTRDA